MADAPNPDPNVDAPAPNAGAGVAAGVIAPGALAVVMGVWPFAIA